MEGVLLCMGAGTPVLALCKVTGLTAQGKEELHKGRSGTCRPELVVPEHSHGRWDGYT